MKYIRFNGGGAPEFVFFLAPLLHKDVAKIFAASGRTPMSAGYYDAAQGTTFGHSSTLSLNPTPEDASMIGALYRATMKLAPRDPLP